MTHRVPFCVIVALTLMLVTAGKPLASVAAGVCTPYIDHFEVTQSVQDGLGADPAIEEAWGGGLPLPTPVVGLIAGRPTTARGYVRSAGDCTSERVWMNGVMTPSPPELVPSILHWDLTGGRVKSGENPTWERTRSSETFNLRFLPSAGVTELSACVGTWIFRPGTGPNEVDYWDMSEERRCVTLPVQFVTKSQPDIRAYSIDYRYEHASNKGTPNPVFTAPDLAPVMYRATWPFPSRYYAYTLDGNPVPWQYNVNGTFTRGEPAYPPGGVRVWEGRERIEALYEQLEILRCLGNTGHDVGYGVAWLPEDAIESGDGRYDRFSKAVAINANNVSALSFAHEFGHLFGFTDLPSGESQQTGWDVIGRTYNLQAQRYPDRYARHPELTDIMVSAFGAPIERWVTQDEYTTVINPAPDLHYPDAYLGYKCGGDYDAANPPPWTDFALVQGGFPVDEQDPGRLGPVVEWSGRVDVSPHETGNTEVRLFDSGRRLLFSTRFQQNANELGAFTVPIPSLPGGAVIELQRGGAVQDVVTRTTNAPAVSIMHPEPCDHITETLSVEWNTSDADGDSLYSTVLFGDAVTGRWVPLAGMTTTNAIHVDATRLPASANASVRVVANDGFNTTIAEVTGLSLLPNRLPAATIVAPSDGEVLLRGDNTIFLGFATDPEDGWVADTNLIWISDIDGVLGIGPGINVYGPLSSELPLSLGPHVIELRSVDSAGAISSDFVSVVVGASPVGWP